MDFRFTEDQLELAEGARSVLEGECTPQRLRALDGAEPDRQVWSELSALGLLGVMAPETCGGLALGAAEFVLIAEAAGKVALPEALVETAGVVAPALAAIDVDAARAVVAGQRIMAVRHETAPFVNAFPPPDDVLLLDKGGISVLPWADADLQSRDSIDPLRRLFAVEGARAEHLVMGSETAAPIVRMAVLRGAVFTAAQLAGLTAGLIDQATAYAKQREQFGAPIGTFQAVKHNLANAFVALEFARPVIYRAAAALDAGHERADLFAAQAKRAAAEAAIGAGEAAIQVHGAMGYTYEVDLHYWMKRVWALAPLWGDEAACAGIIDAAILGDDAGAAESIAFS